MKAGSVKGRTRRQEITENFQEAVEVEPDWVACTRLSSNTYSFSEGSAFSSLETQRRDNLKRGSTDWIGG